MSPGSGSGHGRRGAGRPVAANAWLIVDTSRARSVSPGTGTPSTGPVAAAAGSTGGGGISSRGAGPYTNRATSTCDSDASSRDPVDSADWMATTSLGPSRT